MKILINTEEKTLKLEGSVKFEELQKFIEDNNLKDYSILPDTITVTEKEYYPYYPVYPTYQEPFKVIDPVNPWPIITCDGMNGSMNIPSVFSAENQYSFFVETIAGVEGERIKINT